MKQLLLMGIHSLLSFIHCLQQRQHVVPRQHPHLDSHSIHTIIDAAVASTHNLITDDGQRSHCPGLPKVGSHPSALTAWRWLEGC
jgi:hypothetical protein